MSAMRMSDWPAPTVSIRITSKPAARSTALASAVASATPPSRPRLPIERKNTPSSVSCSTSRTRSPKTAPCVNGLEGSTATTPTFCPALRISRTSAPTSVDLPTPGGPVMPTTSEPAVFGHSAATSSPAEACSSSIHEIARAIARRSPAQTSSARAAGSGGRGAIRRTVAMHPAAARG